MPVLGGFGFFLFVFSQDLGFRIQGPYIPFLGSGSLIPLPRKGTCFPSWVTLGSALIGL